MQYYINVILPIPLAKLFTYSITKAEATFLQPGIRVAVPFGKSKIYTALVHTIHTNAPVAYAAKSIAYIVDKNPIVTAQQLEFWQWVASYYMCSLGEVMRAALPSTFLLESETIIYKNEAISIPTNTLSNNAYLIYEALQENSLKLKDIEAIITKKNGFPFLKELRQKNAILIEEELYEKYKPKEISYIKIAEKYTETSAFKALLNDLQRAPKQRKVVLTYFQLAGATKKPITKKKLILESGVSASVLQALLKKEVFEVYTQTAQRLNYKSSKTEASKTLNTPQNNALQNLNKALQTKDVALLHGVTSSGKTEIYVKIIENTLAEGKQVLYLVPEIALTTQLVSRLQLYFGAKVVVFHSKYSLNERTEVYLKLLEQNTTATIILGARSALFLPFTNLGLVIIDEEHEQSYKQINPAPRYHARDAAIVLANYFKAKTILGSATPSIESYYNATQGKYGLVTLNKRFNTVKMPSIQLINLQEKHKKKQMHKHFSTTLLQKIEDTLTSGMQVILFQNRRGFAPIVSCTTCGHATHCPNCDVTLNYHQQKKQLRCHYCGYSTVWQSSCEACGSFTLDTKGFGTEQIEKEIKALFPKYKVARMDLDTTRGKFAYEKIITAFEAQEIDILVGTQMLTKGLDFRNIKLVGVIQADTMLNFPDFRANERSFQLLLQVAGRAGRTDTQGEVLIQAFNTKHKILQQVVNYDYTSMYNHEIIERKEYKYPPYFKLIKLTVKHRNLEKVDTAALWLFTALHKTFTTNVIGPAFPSVARVRNFYLKDIIVKIPPNQSLVKTKKIILKIEQSFQAIAQFKGVRLVLVVDV